MNYIRTAAVLPIRSATEKSDITKKFIATGFMQSTKGIALYKFSLILLNLWLQFFGHWHVMLMFCLITVTDKLTVTYLRCM